MAVMAKPDECCCGYLYTGRGGASSNGCPVGARQLCAECATEGRGRCPTHRVPVKRT